MKRFNIIKSSRKKSKGIDEKIEYLNKECQKTGLQEVMTTSGMYFASQENPAVPAVTANVPDPTGVLGSGFTPPIGGNGNANDPSNFPAAYDTAWMYNPNNVDGESNRPIVKTMDQSVIDAYNTAFPDDNRFPSGGAGIVFGNIAFGTAVGYASGGHFIQVLNPGLFGNGSTKIVPPGSPFGSPWFGMNSLYFPATPQLADVIMAMSGAYMSLGAYDPSGAMTVALWRRHSTFHDGQWDNWSGKKYIDSTTNNRYVLQNFYMHKAANDYVKEPAQPPTTTVLYRDDLGNPIYIPIDSMSSQAYQYLYGRAKGSNVASSGANYDLYNWILKTYGMPAAEWYLKTGKSQGNPYLPGGAYVPRASNPNQPPSPLAGAQDGDEFAFLPFGGNKGNQGFDPTKKQNRRNTINLINAVNSGDPLYLPPGVTMDQAIQWVDNYNNGNLTEESNLKKYLEEGVSLGHFEPEVLNVDINDIRKGIMPEFPKDPPPEMIGGYSAKSRLVRKEPELPPFIKVTRKDLAKNHLLTDKEISQYMDEINLINDYIKKNPAELIYAMARYPKDDPRLAQLNFKMDEMKRASDRYVETHFPENISLFNKLQNKIKQNIEMTNPKNFTGHAEAPKFYNDDIEMSGQRKKIASKHFKKPVKIKKLFKR